MATIANVLIVGGGIGGMSLGIALGRAGIDAEIVEIKADWSVPGVGISLQGSALRALAALKLRDQVIAAGFGYSQFSSWDADGNAIGTVELPRLNGPTCPATIGIMRRALHDVLREGLARAACQVRLGVSVMAVTQLRSGVNVEFPDGTQRNFDLVVGADGIDSAIREATFGTDVSPQHTGQAVWRATVPRPREVIARHSYFGHQNKAGFNPVSDAEMYIYLTESQPTFARLPDHLLAETLREKLAEYGGLMQIARDSIHDASQILYRPIRSHVLAGPWHRGNVVLIGDAAHATTPHMASGAGIAIEDAIVLSDELVSAPTLADALRNFMSRRYDRCRAVVDGSRQLGEWEINPRAPGADPIALMNRTYALLAKPI